ncbi:hypothetical protein RI129_007164 [Pyrocoelia pectoralis]|uniref:Inner centromere protein ARK-binding domain-containing protein n=1 Tax=Pyrocoelia pectoralis TaxID=417401 RepID=A0AAN7VG25_9COLE
MSVYDELKFEESLKKYLDVLSEFTTNLEDGYRSINSVQKDIEKYTKVGLPTLQDDSPSNQTNGNNTKDTTKISISNSVKEDLPVPQSNVKRITRQNRVQEDVFSDIGNIVKERTNKAERDVPIKTERIVKSLNFDKEVVVKEEIVMPPPTKPPVKSRRKAKNQVAVIITEIKEEVFDNSVIEVPKEPPNVIVLEDSFEMCEPIRVTRARTKKRVTTENGDNDFVLENIGKIVKVERIRAKRKKVDKKDNEYNEKGNVTAATEDETVTSPQKKRARGKNVDRDTIANQNEVHVSPEKDKRHTEDQRSTRKSSMEDVMDISPQKKRGNRGTNRKQNTVQNVESEESIQQTDAQEASDTVPSSQKKRSRGKNSIKDNTVNENESQNEEGKQQTDEEDCVGGNVTSNLGVNNQTLCLTTPVLLKNKPLLPNATIVITNIADDLMTDDEDVVPDSPPGPRQGKVKQVFSPYERSPVKKRVEAFEKLGAMGLEPANTRSKTKLCVKEGKALLHSTPKTQIPKFHVTPLKENKLKNCLTLSASKESTSAVNGKYNISLTGGKTGSALKVSQMEFRERELRRKQKEEEALQKKEALMLSITEEKRRKREEREMKVQQLKATKDKEKQRQFLSAEKIKKEKLKQMMAEKEARYLKQKEEAARKRAAALKKAAEAKQHDATKYNEQIDDVNQIPPFIMHPPPLLPTPDCYDSDDSTRATFSIPQFQKKANLQKTTSQMIACKSFAKLLFSSGPQTPNLREIFPGIQLSKLKRTSSGIWNQTEISILESMIEEE